MAREKVIIIGCDDTSVLPAILDSLEAISFSHTAVTATSVYKVTDIVRSLQPDLVILCFRNNQRALADYCAAIKEWDLPLLCLGRRLDKALTWEKNRAVFICPLEQAGFGGFLGASIQSVFALKGSAPAIPDPEPTHNTANLSRYVMELGQKMEVLLKVKDRIMQLYPRVDDPVRQELMSIAGSIKSAAGDNKLWADFKLYFEHNNPSFLLRLSQRHPELTQNDLKYCCYLKMNMTNDDIRNLLGINQESVRTHKYRLKKKMSLGKEQSLRSYLAALARGTAKEQPASRDITLA
jgi:DNA-binding CsgD family transcriptional regulator